MALGARQGESQELRHLLAAAARSAGTRLLLVLDQFEEFLIVGQREQQEKFVALIADLQAILSGLSLLLVLRSDYQMLLDDLACPLFVRVTISTRLVASRLRRPPDLWRDLA